MEVINCLIGMGQIVKRFPYPFVTFRVSSPFDKILQFSLTQPGVHDFTQFIFFMFIYNLQRGLGRVFL